MQLPLMFLMTLVSKHTLFATLRKVAQVYVSACGEALTTRSFGCFAIRYSRYASRQMSNSILDFPSIHGMEVPSALNI